ncbi:MAG: hypothetical protein NZM25_00410 [Leptospiraceae bacterium]|nr:hypothetical protein [Leptospiraceae bacterium]MDW8306186.1 hypothetical protein [Leptospiraceae bacterium]
MGFRLLPENHLIAQLPLEYHQIIVRTHIRRFHLFYEKYFAREESKALVTFFFEKVYNLEGKTRRDEIASRTYRRFRSLLSERSRDRLEKLLYLNELTDYLDKKLAWGLYQNSAWAAQAIAQGYADDLVYHELLRQENSFEEREQQLQLVLWNLQSFFELSKHPLAEVVMRPAYMAAVMIGAKEIYYMLEEGYFASKPVPRELFYEFVEFVKEKEKQFFYLVYGKYPQV